MLNTAKFPPEYVEEAFTRYAALCGRECVAVMEDETSATIHGVALSQDDDMPEWGWLRQLEQQLTQDNLLPIGHCPFRVVGDAQKKVVEIFVDENYY